MSGEQTLDVLGEALARAILVDCNAETCSAEDLAERHDASRSTIYRKLNALQDAGLVEPLPSTVSPGDSRRYRTTAERFTVTITESEVEVDTVSADRG